MSFFLRKEGAIGLETAVQFHYDDGSFTQSLVWASGFDVSTRGLIVLVSRILVLVISACYLGLAYQSGEARVAVGTVLFLVFPVAMIWFADDLAPTTGLFVDYHRVTGPSPPLLVKLFGFVILLAPAAVALWYR